MATSKEDKAYLERFRQMELTLDQLKRGIGQCKNSITNIEKEMNPNDAIIDTLKAPENRGETIKSILSELKALYMSLKSQENIQILNKIISRLEKVI
jgi:hypothetical protein